MYNTFENSANEFKTKNYNFPAPKSSGGDPTGESIIMIDEKIKNHDTKHTEKENELNTNMVEINKKLNEEITNRTEADKELKEQINALGSEKDEIQNLNNKIDKEINDRLQDSQRFESEITQATGDILDLTRNLEMEKQFTQNLNEKITKYHQSIIINVSEAYDWGSVAFNVYGSGDIVTICNIHTINTSDAKQSFSKKLEELKGMIQTGIGSIVVLIRDNVQSVESLPVNIDNDTISFGVERGQMFGSAIVVQRRIE